MSLAGTSSRVLPSDPPAAPGWTESGAKRVSEAGGRAWADASVPNGRRVSEAGTLVPVKAGGARRQSEPGGMVITQGPRPASADAPARMPRYSEPGIPEASAFMQPVALRRSAEDDAPSQPFRKAPSLTQRVSAAGAGLLNALFGSSQQRAEEEPHVAEQERPGFLPRVASPSNDVQLGLPPLMMAASRAVRSPKAVKSDSSGSVVQVDHAYADPRRSGNVMHVGEGMAATMIGASAPSRRRQHDEDEEIAVVAASPEPFDEVVSTRRLPTSLTLSWSLMHRLAPRGHSRHVHMECARPPGWLPPPPFDPASFAAACTCRCRTKRSAALRCPSTRCCPESSLARRRSAPRLRRHAPAPPAQRAPRRRPAWAPARPQPTTSACPSCQQRPRPRARRAAARPALARRAPACRERPCCSSTPRRRARCRPPPVTSALPCAAHAPAARERTCMACRRRRRTLPVTGRPPRPPCCRPPATCRPSG
jgi:hypothetical protein